MRKAESKNRSSSRSPQSYAVCDDKSLNNSTYDEASEDELYNEQDVMNGLLDLIKTVQKRKKIQHRRQNYSGDDDNDSLTDLEEEERQRVHKEKEYIHKEQKHIQKVHEELCDINYKLQHENKRLRQWDLELRKRESHLDTVEKQLSEYASSLEEIIEKEVKKRCKEVEETCQMKLTEMQKENTKTRNSFKIVKKANGTLKQQFASTQSKIKAYEDKQSALQNRIANLQRKIDILNQQLMEHNESSSNTTKDRNMSKKKENTLTITGTFYEVFSTLLQWVSDVHLKQHIDNMLKVGSPTHIEHDVVVESNNERSIKIVILVSNTLHDVSCMKDNIQLAFIQFIYWSLLYAHLTQSSQKFSHAATYRKIGEELYQAQHGSNQTKDLNMRQQGSFFQSSNRRVKLISSLIILHTISQADIIAHVFRDMNAQLRNELSKDIFLEHHGTVLLQPLFKLTNKVNLMFTTEILMIMAAESPYLQRFLESLSSVEWIQAIVSIMKSSKEDIPLMEKLSLLLQRLSKLRANKPILDALQVSTVVTELARTCSPNEEFLQLNLRSILFNYESMKSLKVN